MDDEYLAASVAKCRECADYYRLRGWNPLPSRMDEKRPLITYANLWEERLSADVFNAYATTNVQVMTGRYWGLLVIDLDGAAAVEKWQELGACPPTWVCHSGGGGRHLWFTISKRGYPLTKAFLWKGASDHEAIERLCDRSLVMAPPSIHPKTGRRYKWLSHEQSPFKLATPASAPDWLLRMPSVQLEVSPGRLDVPSLRIAPAGAQRRTEGRLWRDVVASIPDVVALVQSWGVCTVGHPRASGWIACHAIGRKDVKPSAAIHVISGYYVDSGSGLKLSLVDLAVALGVYHSSREAIKHIGESTHVL